MKRRLTQILIGAVTVCFVFHVIAFSQVSIPQLLAQLSSADWQQRSQALDMLVSNSGALQNGPVQNALLSTLNSENQLIEQTLRMNQGVSDKYGEDYGEYYSRLLDAVTSFANFADPTTVQILVDSTYNPDSPFAQHLASYGNSIVPALTNLANSDVAIIRHTTLSFIGQIVGIYKPASLSPSSRNQLIQALVTGTSDPDIGVQKTASKALQVIGASTPLVTWPMPANVSFGTALGNGQLNAIANVPGAFAYSPATGTMLQVGNGQTLAVTFTPTDTKTYNTVSASTAINVLPGTAPGVQIIVTRVLGRDSSGNIVVQLTLANAGLTAAANAVLTSVEIGTNSAMPLPQAIGTIQPNSFAQATVTLPGSTGAAGAASSLTVTGTYTGGTFSTTARITLP